jgi:hypothetical protein
MGSAGRPAIPKRSAAADAAWGGLLRPQSGPGTRTTPQNRRRSGRRLHNNPPPKTARLDGWLRSAPPRCGPPIPAFAAERGLPLTETELPNRRPPTLHGARHPFRPVKLPRMVATCARRLVRHHYSWQSSPDPTAQMGWVWSRASHARGDVPASGLVRSVSDRRPRLCLSIHHAARHAALTLCSCPGMPGRGQVLHRPADWATAAVSRALADFATVHTSPRCRAPFPTGRPSDAMAAAR